MKGTTTHTQAHVRTQWEPSQECKTKAICLVWFSGFWGFVITVNNYRKHVNRNYCPDRFSNTFTSVSRTGFLLVGGGPVARYIVGQSVRPCVAVKPQDSISARWTTNCGLAVHSAGNNYSAWLSLGSTHKEHTHAYTYIYIHILAHSLLTPKHTHLIYIICASFCLPFGFALLSHSHTIAVCLCHSHSLLCSAFYSCSFCLPVMPRQLY